MKLKDLFEHTPEQIKYAKSAVVLNKIKTNKIKMPRWMAYDWIYFSIPNQPTLFSIMIHKNVSISTDFLYMMNLQKMSLTGWFSIKMHFGLPTPDSTVKATEDDIKKEIIYLMATIFDYVPPQNLVAEFTHFYDEGKKYVKYGEVRIHLPENIFDKELVKAINQDEIDILDQSIFKILQENARKNYPELNK
jgi:hypothetical protein